MSRPLSALGTLAAATLAVATFAADATPAVAQQQQPMRDYAYTFTITSSKSGEKSTVGTMRVSGDRGRIDVEGKRDEQYMLLSNGGRTLTIVHPDRREYEVSDAADFEHIVGSALHAVGRIVSIQLESAHVASDHLGDGGVIDGRSTQRARLTQDFTVRVGALGFGGDAERHVVTTEYWFSPGLTLMRNPLLALVEDAETALAQSDSAYVRVVAGERSRLLAGATPLRRVVTSRDGKDKSSTQTIEISALRTMQPDTSIFVIPSGYTRRTGGLTWLSNR